MFSIKTINVKIKFRKISIIYITKSLINENKKVSEYNIIVVMQIKKNKCGGKVARSGRYYHFILTDIVLVDLSGDVRDTFVFLSSLRRR